ncbi:hypothetical protein OH76DRAFT_1488120 [Lentinus brumalis]|uniref:Uncharacterized protein n=1 Tax=Lentinus brumalis TaxID=2498619 RepID=A0A371CS66_9APHY|nr:hypothetical protein OH76DRAFT_1488120 [Polyporus brumalis]
MSSFPDSGSLPGTLIGVLVGFAVLVVIIAVIGVVRRNTDTARSGDSALPSYHAHSSGHSDTVHWQMHNNAVNNATMLNTTMMMNAAATTAPPPAYSGPTPGGC